MATCAARVPRVWEDKRGHASEALLQQQRVRWKVELGSNDRVNPLEYDAFGTRFAETGPRPHVRHYSNPPNWAWFVDPIKSNSSDGGTNGHSHPCWGHRGSMCRVSLSTTVQSSLGSARLHESEECTFQCTHSGNWLPTPGAHPMCHRLSQDLIIPISEKPDSAMGFEHLIHPKMRREIVEPVLMTQAEADPIHVLPIKAGADRLSLLNLVLTSDVHGFVHGTCGIATGGSTASTSTIQGGQTCTSGAPSLKSILDTIRASSSITRTPTLFLDAGDALHGSGVAPLDVVSVMNDLGVDAMTLGNHELDLGAEGLRDAAERADFPILAANVANGGLSFLSGVLTKDFTVDGATYRVCIIGLSAKEPNPIVGRNLSFTGLSSIGILERELGSVKHCSMNILLSHLGYREDVAIARALNQKAFSLDLILGGHSHVIFGGGGAVGRAGNSGTVIDKSFPYIVGGVPIVHVGANGFYAGLISVDVVSPLKRASEKEMEFAIRGTLQALGVEDGVFPQPMVLPQPMKVEGTKLIKVVTRPENVSICSIDCRKDECLVGKQYCLIQPD